MKRIIVGLVLMGCSMAAIIHLSGSDNPLVHLGLIAASVALLMGASLSGIIKNPEVRESSK